MNTLWLVPLEPFPGRYTEQWYRNIPKAFENYHFNVEVIDGTALTNKIDVGSFLPMNSTVHYKSSQMGSIAYLFQEKKIKNGDKFFIYDLEFWGIEALRLMAQMNKIDIKIYTFLHAASYTREDAFEVAAPYQKYTEVGWIALCDKVFVGSEYHKQAFTERRLKPVGAELLAGKIVVTGNPVFKDEYDVFPDIKKKNQVIISNRFDWEKRPNLSLDFCYLLKKKHPTWSFIVTTGNEQLKSNKKWLLDYARELEKDGIIEVYENLDKPAYHHLLASSKVMLTNSIEENFGYCVIESLIYNTYPLCPNKCSHPELVSYNKNMLFDDEDEIVEKVEFLMQNENIYTSYLKKYYHSMNVIVDFITEEQRNFYNLYP